MKQLVIAGTGQLSLLQILKFMDINIYNFLGFIDDNANNKKRNLYGHKILGGFDWIKDKKDVYTINSIARTTKIREKSTKKLETYGAKFINLIHPSVNIEFAEIGVGNVIAEGVNLEPGVKIGNHNMILRSCSIGHDSTIGDFNFIGIGTIIQGGCIINNNIFLSAGTIIEPNLKIGKGCVSMAGSIIFNNLESSKLIINNPSKVINLPKNSKH